MRFKNLRTGNILSTDNKSTVALMQNSPNYAAVKAPKTAKEGKEKTEAEAQTEAQGEA